MQIFSRTSNWIKKQVAAPSDDFQQASAPEQKQTSRVKSGAAIGAGVGAVAGGGLAYHSVSKDITYFDYVTEQMPLAASGPQASEVFGVELDTFQSLVNGYSESTGSSRETLQYLSYLKHQNPKVPTADLQGIYRSLEGQLGRDAQVRQALNMISAHVEKYGTTPNEAHAEFTNYFGYEADFQKATQTFVADQKLTADELKMTTLQMVKRHSSPLGHLGMGRAVALGVVTGAAVGAVTGVAVGVGVNLLEKLIDS